LERKAMPRRYLWLLVAVFLLPFLLIGNTAGREPSIKVKPIDSAGIDKLIKESEGTVLVVLAAWCFPCRQELPTLVKLYNKYKSQGLEMVGISLDFAPSMTQPMIDKAHVNFPVYWAGEKAVQELNIRAIPLLWLIKKGKMVQEIMGTQSEAFLEKKICELLKN
jgi:thioredoxin-like negative regulator of GroEL